MRFLTYRIRMRVGIACTLLCVGTLARSSLSPANSKKTQDYFDPEKLTCSYDEFILDRETRLGIEIDSARTNNYLQAPLWFSLNIWSNNLDKMSESLEYPGMAFGSILHDFRLFYGIRLDWSDLSPLESNAIVNTEVWLGSKGMSYGEILVKLLAPLGYELYNKQGSLASRSEGSCCASIGRTSGSHENSPLVYASVKAIPYIVIHPWTQDRCIISYEYETSCNDEALQRFKSACRRLNALLVACQNLPVVTYTTNIAGAKGTVIEQPEFEAYMRSHKYEFRDITSSLWEFVLSCPKSEYVTDAYYLLLTVHGNLCIAGGDDSHCRQSMTAYHRFVAKVPYEGLRLWTEGCFRDTLCRHKGPTRLSPKERLVACAKYHIVLQFLALKEVARARSVLRELAAEYPRSDVSKTARKTLDWLDRQERSKPSDSSTNAVTPVLQILD